MPMDKEKPSIERTILLATSVLGGLGGLFTAINSLSDSGRKIVGMFTKFDEWQLGFAAAALAALSLWLFRLARRRRSVLLRPEALRLERGNPAHLFGRADDVDQLARLCREESLVFIEGESGAGKSALLQAGLVPALKGHQSLFPIYIESLVGSDWERDPRTFLAAALWPALDEGSREILDLNSVPGPNALRAVLEAIPAKLGRAPLLLLDQFDDYQLRHRERFLSRKTWLKPGRLAEQNGFWRDIRELVANGAIHLVVVTRTDTAAGLTSVRFTEPEVYRLDRLSAHFVGPLLGELANDKAGQPVISDAEFGWTSLLPRLSADLERAGTILPQQLKIVLGGLGALPGRVLTVATYERVGGAAGLEARFIEERIAKAARLHGATEERVRAALLTLVDPITGQKTIERRTRELLSCIDPTAPEKAQAALDQLELEEVVRRRVDPGTGDSAWLLDHDYLARAVREADRRANRWQRVLAEGANALVNAGTSWALWWRALLPPRTQLAFFWDRLRGRFRYGHHRLYAVKSLPRLAPYIAPLLVVLGLGLYQYASLSEQRISKTANDILNGIEFPQLIVSESDAAALVRLASADEPVRQLALQLILINAERARVFIRQPEIVVRALAGVSPRFRDLAEASLARAAAAFPPSPETSIAIVHAGRLIGRPEAVSLAWRVAVIKNTTDPYTLRILAKDLRQVLDLDRPGELPRFDQITDTQVKDVIESFLAAIEQSADPYALEALEGGLEELSYKFTRGQAQEAVEPFLAAIKRTTDPHALRCLSAGLKLFSATAEVGETQVREAIEPFLSAIKRATAPLHFRALGEGLEKLPTKLSDSQGKGAVELFLAAMKRTSDPGNLDLLAEGLAATPAELTDSQAKDAVELLLAPMKRTNAPSFLESLSEGLRAIIHKLTRTQAQDAVEHFVSAIRSAADPYLLRALGGVLAPLSAQAAESKAKFGDFFVGMRYPYAPLARLTEDQAKEVTERFLTALRGATAPKLLGALLEGLGAVEGKLTDGQADDALKAFVAAIPRVADADDLGALKAGLEGLRGKLTDSQGRAAVDQLLLAIENTADPYGIGP
jgi:hypothetical protein